MNYLVDIHVLDMDEFFAFLDSFSSSLSSSKQSFVGLLILPELASESSFQAARNLAINSWTCQEPRGGSLDGTWGILDRCFVLLVEEDSIY